MALYDRTGYTRLFDSSIDPEAYFHLRFGKDLADPSRTSTLADPGRPCPNRCCRADRDGPRFPISACHPRTLSCNEPYRFLPVPCARWPPR